MLVPRSLAEASCEVSGDGGTRSPLLSVGTYCAGNRAVALRETAAGRLLAVDHHFWRSAGSGSIRLRGNDSGFGAAARNVPGIWKAFADSGARKADSRYSLRGTHGGVGRTVF